jgi:hypothetical protein
MIMHLQIKCSKSYFDVRCPRGIILILKGYELVCCVIAAAFLYLICYKKVVTGIPFTSFTSLQAENLGLRGIQLVRFLRYNCSSSDM